MELDYDLSFFGEMFARTFRFWWVILPSIFLGLIVGAIPGFSAANTIIILLPLTLAMDPETGLMFMIGFSNYASGCDMHYSWRFSKSLASTAFWACSLFSACW